MSITVSVKLDDEQEDLLKELLKARRDKSKSRIIRESLWCYAEKILPNFTTAVVNTYNSNSKRGQDEN